MYFSIGKVTRRFSFDNVFLSFCFSFKTFDGNGHDRFNSKRFYYDLSNVKRSRSTRFYDIFCDGGQSIDENERREFLFSIRIEIFRSKRLIVDKINKTNQIFPQANENLSFHRIGRSRCYKNEAPKFPTNIDFGRIKSHSIGCRTRLIKIFR